MRRGKLFYIEFTENSKGGVKQVWNFPLVSPLYKIPSSAAELRAVSPGRKCFTSFPIWKAFLSSGDRVVVGSNTTVFNETAVLVSPPYNRSRDWHTKCLKFRFMMRGLGKKSLTIYQRRDNYRQVPIWFWKGNTGHNWIYGQAPLSAISAFQVGPCITALIIKRSSK